MIRDALQRGQLTGDEGFRAEISSRLGIRISNKGPGTPNRCITFCVHSPQDCDDRWEDPFFSRMFFFRTLCNGNTPLHSAANNGNYEVVKVLVEAGADKSIQSDNNKTALVLAIEGDYPATTEFPGSTPKQKKGYRKDPATL